MTTYALLLAPSANRVYTQAAEALAVAELKAFGGVDNHAPLVLGGHTYLTFDTSPAQLQALANLSSAYAFFELEGDGLLRPVEAMPLDRFDDDLITIPKYAGKTNESFTKLLLNVTALASAWSGEFLTKKFTVVDPVAGRGTTLNQALMYGWNSVGIEIERKHFEAYEAYLKTYLRRKRIKHRAEVTPVRREGSRLGRRFFAEVDGQQQVTLFEADTARSRELMRAGSADLIVADLPYGVVHASRTQFGGRERGPAELLKESLQGWSELLRPGGALGMSWNTHVAPRDSALRLLEAHGLTPCDDGGFEHWVDQGITRDIVLARKA